MERGIGSYHPIVSFTYFAIIIIASMLFIHPVFCFISLFSAVLYSYILDKENTKKILSYSSIMAIMIALANAAFVNRGVTVLFYFRANPVTLESLLYGVLSGTMMMGVILWFACYNEIITSDKFLYIFGKTLPSIALMVSMTLRLIPKLINQTKIIANTQKTVGLDYSEGTIKMKIKSCMRILSILVTWALEDAVHTADSMKARGYGTKKRSNFSIFNFVYRDMLVLIFISIIGLFLAIGYMNGYGQILFYPTIEKIKFDYLSILLYLSYFILSILPVLLELEEEYRWKYSELKG
ncbi:MAG: energy-coupling factor transporter transmembrane component T [Peptostreptococcaceae bacterium]